MDTIVNAIKDLLIEVFKLHPETALIFFSVLLLGGSWYLLSKNTYLNPALLQELCIKEQMGHMYEYRNSAFEKTLEAFDETYKLEQTDFARQAFKNVIRLCLNKVEKYALDSFREDSLHLKTDAEMEKYSELLSSDFITEFTNGLDMYVPGWFPGLSRDDFKETIMNKQIILIVGMGKSIILKVREIAKKWHSDKKYVRSKVKAIKSNFLG